MQILMRGGWVPTVAVRTQVVVTIVVVVVVVVVAVVAML